MIYRVVIVMADREDGGACMVVQLDDDRCT